MTKRQDVDTLYARVAAVSRTCLALKTERVIFPHDRRFNCTYGTDVTFRLIEACL